MYKNILHTMHLEMSNNVAKGDVNIFFVNKLHFYFLSGTNILMKHLQKFAPALVSLFPRL
jgi:hypothetical protein